MGMAAAKLFDVELPQRDKRLLISAETDGCFVDGVAVASRCWVGDRTLRVLDYGKTAVTFVHMQTERAHRIIPALDSRMRAPKHAPVAPDRWHAQLTVYQIMPASELLVVEPVKLTVSLAHLIGVPLTRGS